MTRIARTSGQKGDSRVPLGCRVRDASGERAIACLPAGKGRPTLREMRPTAGAARTPIGSAGVERS